MILTPVRNVGWLGSVWKITTVNPIIESFENKMQGINESHISPFPEEIPNRLISMYSRKDDIVLDPFCGSGTTNYVAIALGRKTIGYDTEEKYVYIAKKRSNFMGRFYCRSS